MYKNASYEAVNRVRYYQSLIKQADFNDVMSTLNEYKSPLIGAGLGMGLGYLLAPEKHKLLGALGGGLLGGLGGYGWDRWNIENQFKTLDDGSLVWTKPGKDIMGNPYSSITFSPDQLNYLKTLNPDVKKFISNKGELVNNGPGHVFTLSNFFKLPKKEQYNLYFNGLANNTRIGDDKYTPEFLAENGIDDAYALAHSSYPTQALGSNRVSYLIGLGRTDPKLSYLLNPRWYLLDNLRNVGKKMIELNMYLEDIGNPYSPKWLEVQDQFNEFNSPYMPAQKK